MKKIFFFALATLLTFSFCKTKSKTTQTTSAVAGKYKGKVSHMYKSTGCAAVIILQDGSEKPVLLIPKDPLPGAFDKDEKLIHFNYRVLKMKNPPGCDRGIPAEVTDVSD